MNNFYENIEDYLAEKLSAADKISFEKELSQNENIRQSVDNQRNVIMLLQQSKLREQVKRNLEEAKKEARVVSIAPMQQLRKVAAVVGVVFALGITYWAFQKPTVNNDVVQQPTVPTTIDTASQKNTPIETPKVKDWLQEEKKPVQKKTQVAQIEIKDNLFHEPESHVRGVEDTQKSKGLSLCENYFEIPTSQRIENQQDSTNFYNGISFLKNKKYEDASRSFLKIEEESPIYGESQWFFALSLLARERYDTAKNILEDIAKQEKNQYQTKAKAVLNGLDN